MYVQCTLYTYIIFLQNFSIFPYSILCFPSILLFVCVLCSSSHLYVMCIGFVCICVYSPFTIHSGIWNGVVVVRSRAFGKIVVGAYIVRRSDFIYDGGKRRRSIHFIFLPHFISLVYFT